MSVWNECVSVCVCLFFVFFSPHIKAGINLNNVASHHRQFVVSGPARAAVFSSIKYI